MSVNGKPLEVEEGWSIARLLETLQLHPLRVAVVLNQEIVKRQHYETTLLKEGDKVEIVTIMAGGGSGWEVVGGEWVGPKPKTTHHQLKRGRDD